MNPETVVDQGLTLRAARAWRNSIFTVFFVSGLWLASWVARLPAVRDGLQLSTAQVGILIFGMSAGSIFGLVVAPWLLARLAARTAILLSVTVTTAGLVTVGIGVTLLPSAPLVFVALAFVGFGMGSVDVMLNVEGTAVERVIGKTLLPLMHACFSLGTVVGALIGVGASALHIDVVWHLAGAAVLALASTVVAVRFIPYRANPGAEHLTATAAIRLSSRGWRERLRDNLTVWKDLRLVLIGVIVLGMAFAEGSANDWIALASVDGHGFDNTTGAIVFGIFVAAMTAGRVAGGPVLDRFGRVAVLRACAVMGIVGLLLFILAPTTWLLVVGTVLWGLGASLGFPVGMSAAADDPRHAAARVSAVAIIGYCAFLVGPPVLGVIGEHFGILNALYVVLALMVLAGLAVPAARERSAADIAGR